MVKILNLVKVSSFYSMVIKVGFKLYIKILSALTVSENGIIIL